MNTAKKKKPSNEIEYCKSTIYPLLQATKGLQRVKYRHGNIEFGKDFTFSYLNPLAVWINCGVQVKYGDITGNSNRLITDLVNQIPVAFSVPYKDVPSESDNYIDELYIICSGSYKDNAIRIIESQLLPNKYSIQFWDGEHVSNLRERVLITSTEASRDVQQVLNSLLIEIEFNIDTAKTIVNQTDTYIKEKKHHLLNYKLDCLERTLGSNIDDDFIIRETGIEWRNLTIDNNILSEIRIHGSAKNKLQLKENGKGNIKNLTNFKNHIIEYLKKIQ